MGFDFDGKFQKYRRDAFYRGTCDEGVKKLAELCGWKVKLYFTLIFCYKMIFNFYFVLPG